MNTDVFIVCNDEPLSTVDSVDKGGIFIERILKEYKEFDIFEQWVEIKNVSDSVAKLTRVDSLKLKFPKDDYTIKYYDASIQEFKPIEKKLQGTVVIEETEGRSARTYHPWFSLTNSNGEVFSCALAWSGNWKVLLDPQADGGYILTAGLSNWCFQKNLKPGEVFEGIKIVFTQAANADAAALAFQQWGKAYVYPKTDFSEPIPIVWNHWWPYEDVEINEDVFKKNVDCCAEMGIDVCVLDAGWFGSPDPDCNSNDQGWSENVDWYLKRGDWDTVNTMRFPSGIAALADYVKEKGMRFGIWCEIEALGKKAWLKDTHPEFEAMRDGDSLDYVCFGNPAVVDWAYGVLENLIVNFKAEWIKIDFNLNPRNGCNRCDHGHEAGDGLYEHYMGFYRLLERVREKYPNVFLENCSSGGHRIDLGIARHTHAAFLSDPDHTQLHLREFWGAVDMLHASHCYHFTWSQIRVDYPSNIEMNPIAEGTSKHKIDYLIRANMLNRFAISYRLPELSQLAKDRLTYHIDIYRNIARDYVLNGELYRLTEQAFSTFSQVDDPNNIRNNAFVFVKDKGNEALMYVFKLGRHCAGTNPNEAFNIKLKGLNEQSVYTLRYEDSGEVITKTGKELMENGLTFKDMPDESSEIIYINTK